MEAIDQAVEAPCMDDLYGAMEAIDMDCPKIETTNKTELLPLQKEMVKQVNNSLFDMQAEAKFMRIKQ